MLPFYFYTRSKKQNGHPEWGIKKPFCWISSPGKHHALFSSATLNLAGTNLIMLLIFLFNPRLLPKKIHPPFDFRENSSSFDFREKSIKTPNENQKKKMLLFLLLSVFSGYVLGFYLLLCHWISILQTLNWQFLSQAENHNLCPQILDLCACAGWTGKWSATFANH